MNLSNVIKRRKTANYTQINNLPIQEDIENLAAIGLLTYIMSLPEDWTLYKTQLYNKFTRRTVEGAWKILLEKRYAIGFKCYLQGGSKGIVYFYNVSDIPFTQDDFDSFIEDINKALLEENKSIVKPEMIKDSPFTIPKKFSNVQNVQHKNNSTKSTTTKEVKTKETDTNKHLLSNIVNNGQAEEFLLNTCNEFYAEFAKGRWSKKQWSSLIKKFVGELIASKRYKSIHPDKIKPYIHRALANMADHHDYKHSQNFIDYQDIRLYTKCGGLLWRISVSVRNKKIHSFPSLLLT
ncbi:hypothetical protein [Virgibacillus sp. SK37]|uniref:hypothetical protein n=1 Tax=Virgibacillus sp. SK37 TaxID=403957 RepID=UPI0004D12E0E|nr:hypothetical protein [Virgibacillus sp. SK37]AIF43433.1 hypothetical protein X953_09930 [Virgibacillus sp. SK37]